MFRFVWCLRQKIYALAMDLKKIMILVVGLFWCLWQRVSVSFYSFLYKVVFPRMWFGLPGPLWTIPEAKQIMTGVKQYARLAYINVTCYKRFK